MRKKNKKPLRRKIVLRLPDLDHSKKAYAPNVLPDWLKILKRSAKWHP